MRLCKRAVWSMTMKINVGANNMTLEQLEAHCLRKLGACKEYPFDETTAVFKVGNKMFALYDETALPPRINVKCDPYYALELRAMYPSVTGGYHMNKKHWNTITCNDEIEDALVLGWIDDSYELVFDSLSRKLKAHVLQ